MDLVVLILVLATLLSSCQAKFFVEDGLGNPKGYRLDENQCNLAQEVLDEIRSYQSVADQISASILQGQHKGTTYNQLADFVDKFGHRLAGSQTLEDSIDFVLQKSLENGLDEVKTEPALSSHWVRGAESANLKKPYEKPLRILGFGGTIATPPEGITAEAIVVNSFEELNGIQDKVSGKIVVYNEDYISYGQAGPYRWSGSNASAYGAVATLVRSLTPFSLDTPHTGWSEYQDGLVPIPTAAITVEDAHFLRRLQDRGEIIEIEIKMDDTNYEEIELRNGFAQISGTDYPGKYVVVSGHIDSWDVGQGSMDDGAGVILSWNSLLILKSLGLVPRRSLQMIFFTSEEVGLGGSTAHFEQHKHEIDNYTFMMELDMGTFKPVGLHVAGPNETACIVQEIVNLIGNSVNATGIEIAPIVGSDIGVWIGSGVPGADLWSENDRYFWYHHSPADTLDTENSDILDLNTALMTTVAYVVADLSFDMPRK